MTRLEQELVEVFDRHRRRLRVDGVEVSAELRSLEEVVRLLVRFLARSRQEPTFVDCLPEPVDAGPMPLLIDLDEAARQLSVSRRQADRLAKAGTLPTVQIGERNRRVRTADLAEYVEGLKTRVSAKDQGS